ncbi:carnitine O-acetyltransferase [Malassezia sp. CBS 17886]|nr:carnitine O-acetyltransferase [Malassezia sp. CBS 17886]
MSHATRASSTSSSAPLYSGQASLPHLPVPELEATLTKYLRTTLPLHKTPESLVVTERAVKDALQGKDAELMKKLQERLVHRAQAEGRESWLSDWWLSAAYMGYRDPVVPFVSYFYLHRSDPRVRTGITRAAQLLKAFQQFRTMLVTEQLAPEKTKTGFLCMSGYKWMFNTSRVPVAGEDQSVAFDPATHHHIAVAYNGYFFEFDIVNPHTGKELSVPELEIQLEKIVSDPRAQTMAPSPVGALTSDTRDNWAAARAALLGIGGAGAEQNRKALERIDSSVIVLALDSCAPVTLDERAWQVWTGGGKNRYFDKQQLIVAENGTSGYIGEHSMMDGTHTLRLNNFALTALEQNKIDLKGPSSGTVLEDPAMIEFVQDANIETRVRESQKGFSELIGEHAMSILEFDMYAKDVIKAYKCSPDAWAQMCIQLAYFKMFGEACATYEAAQTRKFKLGRTETIRSTSPESLAFVKAMTDADASDETRLKAFQAGAAQHIKYARGASEAQGVDRHLFGLKRVLQEGEKLPDVFTDPMNAASGTWLLSTSQISTEVFDAWGFGEVATQGFGVAYAIKQGSLTFTVTCLKKEHNPFHLTHYIKQALIELRALHERTAKKAALPKM